MTEQKNLNLGISDKTVSAWRKASEFLGDKELDEWLEHFVEGTNEKGDPLPPEQVPELTWAVFQEFIRSKEKKTIDALEEKHKERPQIENHMQSIMDDANALSDDMAIALEVIPKGGDSRCTSAAGSQSLSAPGQH